ncbi:unnamed protein product [Effrenium voratum]|nr:unnamed protein product [Effrenium voratum]
MPRQSDVRIEIEHHFENTFHTTYAVERYSEYAQQVQRQMNVQLESRDINVQVVTNPGPPKGFSPFWSCQGWFTSTKGEKVRYPRLGAFEVFAEISKDFAPKSGLPPRMQLWSKLCSHRWPDPTRLAEKLAELLSSGRENEDVSEEVRALNNRWTHPEVPEKPKVIPHAPMFFGLTPRGGTPTPVERRIPGEKRSANSSPRPSSAFATMGGSSLMVSPGKIRPSSAKQMRSLQDHEPASEPATPKETPQKSPDVPAFGGFEERFEDDQDNPPSFRDSGAAAPASAPEKQPEKEKDAYYDEFEDNTTVAGPNDEGDPPESAPVPASPAPASPRKKEYVEDLAQRLLQKHGSSAKPAELLRRPMQPFDPEEPLDETVFKTKLYHLGVFSEPFGGFSFAGLFLEIAAGTPPTARLGDLIEHLKPFFPSDAAQADKDTTSSTIPTSVSFSPETTKVTLPAAEAEEDKSDYGSDFEEDQSPKSAAPGAAPAPAEFEEEGEEIEIPLDDSTEQPLSRPAPAPEDDRVGAVKHYSTDDFEDVSEEALPAPSAPAPVRPAVPAAAPPAGPPVLVEENSDMDPDYNEEFEVQSDDGEIAASPVPVELEDPAESISEDEVFADPVREGTRMHDYAENFDSFSDGISEVNEDEDMLQ